MADGRRQETPVRQTWERCLGKGLSIFKHEKSRHFQRRVVLLPWFGDNDNLSDFIRAG